MITVEATSSEQVQAALARELDCRLDSDALQRATIAEHTRALVFGSWTRRSPEAAPLHTTRILSNVRRTQRFVWPQHGWEHEKLGDLCRQVLDDLEVLGDIVSVGNGFWIPGPSIFVELDGVNHLMVSGGTPTQITRTHFEMSVTSTAAFRFAPRRSVLSKSSNANLLRSIDGWLGHADPLREWAQAVLQEHSARLSIDMDIAVDQLDVYAPEIFRDQRKSGRWMHAKLVGRPLDGLRLCRLQSSARVFGAPHFLATFHFDAGTLTLGRSVRLAPDVSRRLRFGIDALLGTPRQVSVEVDGTQFRFDNSVSLPESEARVLSLAWRTLRNPEDQSELRYFHPNVLPLLSRALARLLIIPKFVDRRPHA
jgi:hypothetical protein